LGGDEFPVLIPGVSCGIAEQQTDVLVHNLNGCSLHWNGGNISIGASVGLAHYIGNDDKQSMLQRADEAMYLAKFQDKARSQSRKNSAP